MPTTTVGAIIIDKLEKPEKILLTRRNIPPFKEYWCLPGGHIDKYEKAIDGVVREIQEETGLNLEPIFLHFFDEIFPQGNVHNIVLMFYGTVKGNIKIQEEEVADIRWFSFDEALKLDLAFTHNVVLEYFVKKFV